MSSSIADQSKLPIMAAGAALLALGAAYMLSGSKQEHIVVLGDVGGTNMRLTLKAVNIKTRTSRTIKQLTKYPSQKLGSFEEGIKSFLKEFKGTDKWPTVGVIGIAGEVNNNCVRLTNCPDWPVVDGNAIKEELKFKEFELINDFAAAGYGVCMLSPSDCIKLDNVTPQEDGVKVVMGPGSGLGEGYLTKSRFSKCYEVFSSEGGHVDFNVTSEDDWNLRNFALKYIPTSENVENQRGKGPLSRVSIERLCAGPAVPIIYEYIKEQNKDLPRVLETAEKTADQLESGDIISCGMQTKDALCQKVIKKFAEILAVEVGNMALKTKPFGGIYLVGGVTTGIAEYLELEPDFLETFVKKGRLSDLVRRIPVFIVKPTVELGILGAEECAFRHLGNFGQ